jgi:hypothetical protein
MISIGLNNILIDKAAFLNKLIILVKEKFSSSHLKAHKQLESIRPNTSVGGYRPGFFWSRDRSSGRDPDFKKREIQLLN